MKRDEKEREKNSIFVIVTIFSVCVQRQKSHFNRSNSNCMELPSPFHIALLQIDSDGHFYSKSMHYYTDYTDCTIQLLHN